MFEFSWQRQIVALMWKEGNIRGEVLETWLDYKLHNLESIDFCDLSDWLHEGDDAGYWKIVAKTRDRWEIQMPLPKPRRFRVVEEEEPLL